MQGHQYRNIRLGRVNFAAGGTAQVKFDKLGAQKGGRGLALRSIQFRVKATPTLSSGSATAVELNKMVKTLRISDAVKTRYEGLSGFPGLRAFEALESGRVPYPEPDAALTTETVNFQRVFDLALPTFARPHDFADTAAVWLDGLIEFGFSALADVDSNCTALTAEIDVFAQVFVTDDLLLGTQLERKEQLIKRDVAVGREALYAFLGLAKTSAFGVFTAGDVGKLAFNDEAIDPEQIDARALTDQYHRDMRVGAFTEVHGELTGTTDDNAKVAAGTAIAAAPSYIQPGIWSPPGSRISKVQYSARPNLTLANDGTLTEFYALISRLVPRSSDDMAKYVAVINNKLGLKLDTWGRKIVTLGKHDYKGTRVEYQPVKFKRPVV